MENQDKYMISIIGEQSLVQFVRRGREIRALEEQRDA